MAKPSPLSKSAAAHAAADRRGASVDPKGSINLRIEAKSRQLIDEAATLLGKTGTEFMIDRARAQAIDEPSTSAVSRSTPSAMTPSCRRSTIRPRRGRN
jgi:hypothetical protein